jgi:hypothetical protein
MARLTVALAAAHSFTLTSGCGVSGSLQGTVSSMPARDAQGAYVGPKPIAGARIRLECADGTSAPLLLESDAAGRFSAALPAPFANTCHLSVSKLGFRERVYSVAEACARDMGSECKYLSLLARLLPEGAK